MNHIGGQGLGLTSLPPTQGKETPAKDAGECHNQGSGGREGERLATKQI